MPDIEPVLDDKEIKFLPYQYIEQIYIRKIHHFYLSSIIEEPHKYTDMIHQIRTAPPDDDIFIHLNIQGGTLSTGIQIVNAIQASEAHVICSLEAEAHSLGTLIFLSADEFMVHDNCTMLFHNFSGGVFGKGNEQAAEIKATLLWFSNLVEKLYQPFLSEDEVARLLKGEDFWFQSEEIRTRLQNMVAQIEKENEQLNKQKRKTRTPKKTQS